MYYKTDLALRFTKQRNTELLERAVLCFASSGELDASNRETKLCCIYRIHPTDE